MAAPSATSSAEVAIRPLAARSAVLSVLLGAHPPELPARVLVEAALRFGIAESTLRVALTRMVTTGDLDRADGVYRLSSRLLARQRRQDEALAMTERPWQGDWSMVVITATGRTAVDRARLRDQLARRRLGELREGVWLRPDNVDTELVETAPQETTRFTLRPVDDPIALTRSLWDLDHWSRVGRTLLAKFSAAADEPGVRLATAAAMVRHLLTDPLLPPPLLPAHWPSGELRRTYAGYQDQLAALARSLQTDRHAAPGTGAC